MPDDGDRLAERGAARNPHGARRLRAAEDIRAGGVWINTSEFLFNESPFGGVKASGFGRELSMHAMDAYTDVKNVGISLGAHMPTFEL